MTRIKRSDAERLLACVPEEHVFRCYDGREVRNIMDLYFVLTDMSEEAFAHHCSGARCDFAIWVRDVIGDDKLARDLVKATNRRMAVRDVERRVAYLDSKLAWTFLMP